MIFVILLIAVLMSKEAYHMCAFLMRVAKVIILKKGSKQKCHILVNFSLRITKIWQVYCVGEQLR